MQKLVYSLLTTVLFCAFLPAQSLWFQEGTTFYHDVGQINAGGYLETKLEKDTVMAGVPCKKFSRHFKFFDYNQVGFPLSGEGDMDPIFMYASADDKEVYYYQYGEFFKMYDFNKEIGELWTLPFTTNTSELCPNNDFMIIEKGSEVVDGVNLKWVDLSTTSESEYFYSGRVYQKIGSIYHYFPSIVNETLCFGLLDDMNFVRNFRCMSDDNFSYVSDYVQQNYQGRCNFPEGEMSVNDSKKPTEQITLYPNPAHNQLQVKTSNEKISGYQILDAIGQTVRSGKTTGSETIVTIQDLVPGVYFLKFMDKNNKAIKAKKFIKK